MIQFNSSDLYSSWIDASVDTNLEIFATDQPSCEIASANKETYACSSGSSCQTGEWGGYFCYCNPLVAGNPTFWMAASKVRDTVQHPNY